MRNIFSHWKLEPVYAWDSEQMKWTGAQHVRPVKTDQPEQSGQGLRMAVCG